MNFIFNSLSIFYSNFTLYEKSCAKDFRIESSGNKAQVLKIGGVEEEEEAQKAGKFAPAGAVSAAVIVSKTESYKTCTSTTSIATGAPFKKKAGCVYLMSDVSNEKQVLTYLLTD